MIFGPILANGTDAIGAVIEADGLSDCPGSGAEKFYGCTFGENDRSGNAQCRSRVSYQEPAREHPKKITIGKIDVLLFEGLSRRLHRDALVRTEGENAGALFYFREVPLHGGADRQWTKRARGYPCREDPVPRQAVDPILPFMILIIAKFALYEQDDEQADGDTNGQPEYIDQGIDLIL